MVWLCKTKIWDVETRFDTSSYESDRPLLKGKNEKVTGLMKDELGRKIVTKVVKLIAKTYSYVIYDGSEDKKTKGTKKCALKENLNLKITKN